LPAGRVIAIDASALVHGFDETPDILTSNEATVHMDSAPADLGIAGSPNLVAAPTVSLFQTGQTGLRLVLDMAFAKRVGSAVAYMDNITSW
jgi:hypothetical protein